MLRDVGIAYFGRSREEPPRISGLCGSTGVKASLGVGGTRKGAVEYAPFPVDDDSVPPVVRARTVVEFGDLSGRLEISIDNLCVQTRSQTHFHGQDGHLFGTSSTCLDDASGIDLPLEIFLPSDFLTHPGEDGSEPLHVTPVRPTDVPVDQSCGIRHGWNAADEPGVLVDQLEIDGLEVGRIRYWHPVKAFVAFHELSQGIDGSDDWVV